MFCTMCGKELPDGAKFCTNCGAPVAKVMPDDASEDTVLPDGADETSVMPEHAEATVLPAAETEGAAESGGAAEPEGAAEIEDPADAERAEAAADAAAAERALWSTPEDAADAALPETTVFAPAHMANAETGQDGQQPASEPSRKKRPVALIGTILLLIVAAGAFFGIFVLPRITGKDVPMASYGQTDPVQCSVVTRVRPRDNSGNELTSYAVRLTRRVTNDASSSSASEELTEVVAEIIVTGNNGFTMESFGEVPDGDYELVIVPNDSQDEPSPDSSSEEQRIPVHYEKDNPRAEEEVVVEPPAPEVTSPEESAAEDKEFTDDQIASALFYYTCQKLIDEYGESGSVELHDGMEIAASGLALAERIDFDSDGMDELLTVVRTNEPSDAAAFSGEDTYQVAVWRYADGTVEQVYEGTAPYSNGGYFYLDLFAYQLEDEPAQTMIYDMRFTDPTEPDTEVTHTGYYALAEDGFQPFAVCDSVFYYSDGRNEETYTLEGAEATEDDWTAFEEAVEQVASYKLSMSAGGFDAQSDDAPAFEIVDAAALPQRTEDTLTALEEAAGTEALEAFAPEGDAEAEEDPAEAAYTYAENEADVTFTTSQGGGSDWEETRSWTYPRFTLEDGSTTEALDELNASLEQSYEDDLAVTQAWTIDSGDAQVWVHRDEVTYLEGNIACVRSERYTFLGGAHGEESTSGAFYDLSSGNELRVDEALGISWDDLQAESVDAIKAYLASNPNLSGADDAPLEGMASDASRYFATDDGVVIAIMPYEVGSYSEGTQLVYVHAFEDQALVGTSAAS